MHHCIASPCNCSAGGYTAKSNCRSGIFRLFLFLWLWLSSNTIHRCINVRHSSSFRQNWGGAMFYCLVQSCQIRCNHLHIPCLGCQWSCDRKRRGVHRATAHYDGSCIRNFKSCLLTPRGSSGLMYLSARTPEIALSSATFISGGVIYHNVYSNCLLVWAILLATSSSRHWKNPESRNLEQKNRNLGGWRSLEDRWAAHSGHLASPWTNHIPFQS